MRLADVLRWRISRGCGVAALLASCCLGLAAFAQEPSGYHWVEVTIHAPFTPRDGAGALTYGGRMWLIGGWNARDDAYFPLDCVNDVWSSKDGLTWTMERPNTFGKPEFDPAREWEGRHTAGYVVFQDAMWIVGGDPLQGHYQFDVWNSADGKVWSRVNKGNDVPWCPRVLFYTVAFKDKIWVMGGQTTPQYAPAEERFYNDIWNTSDGVNWTQVTPDGPHWEPRGMIGGSVVFQDQMWILGGGTYDTPAVPQRKFYNDVWSSPDGVKWTCHTENAPWHPRQYHDVAVWDGKMWVTEGWNKENRNDVWYSDDGVNWHEVPNTPWKIRHAASLFVYDDALWMVAGNNMEPDVWKLVRNGQAPEAHASAGPSSKTIAEVIREPLAPEDLHCTAGDTHITIQGPTFRYVVDRASGVITEAETLREGKSVVRLLAPADVVLDGRSLAGSTRGVTQVLADGTDKVVLLTEGEWGSGVPNSLEHTFYNDGVVVSRIALTPKADLPISQGIRYEVRAAGAFSQYLHKRRDTNGMDCLKGALPAAGDTVNLAPLTSCLEVFSREAALAVFTDRGGSYRSPEGVETASLSVEEAQEDRASVRMTQHVIHVGSGGGAYTVRAGETFSFRVGMALAPNRHPHPRWRDLRMFIWVGDGKHPYPSDEEIQTAARLGFTLFQMHRLGTPGEPRPPAGELERVLKTVHDAGMLFLWTANADLMYVHAPEVAKLLAAGEGAKWQGFNYGGKYTASMDPYCDLMATCLASPNGLADYRVQCKERMLEKYAVDGMYIDDNLPYENCTLATEHGHPEQVYDCLIELHDMNWRRRQTLLKHCPHAVLIDHCSHGMILPAIAPFDGHLFGEGYSFPSVEGYWDTFACFQNMYAAGSLFAGDSETTRCGAEVAYAFDLLTGGGQYSYLDWRLWPEKFPYAAGVSPYEVLFVRTYNLAQYFFGMYESTMHYLPVTAPNTYATLYHNAVWGEVLAVLVNVSAETAQTSVTLSRVPLTAPSAGQRLVIYDVNLRTVAPAGGNNLAAHFREVTLDPRQMKLLYVRNAPAGAVYHQWGGKRISETWDVAARTLTLRLSGPAGLEDAVLLGTGGQGIERVTVDGKPAAFCVEPDGTMAHGTVTFGAQPVTLEVVCSADGACSLPEASLGPDELTTEYLAKQNAAP